MDASAVVIFQLVLFALGAIAAVMAALSARRAASFDVTRDFDALAHAVMKLQHVARSEKMTRVRAAAAEQHQPAQPVSQQSPLSHEQLRAIARARRNGAMQ